LQKLPEGDEPMIAAGLLCQAAFYLTLMWYAENTN
jgi:hypothetical protein